MLPAPDACLAVIAPPALAALCPRCCRARERRKQQEALDRTKKLGEADAEVDDVMTWVSKSRK